MAAARIGCRRHNRNSVLNVAKNRPAVANARSPSSPCAPMVESASPPITATPAPRAGGGGAGGGAGGGGRFSRHHRGGQAGAAGRRGGRRERPAGRGGAGKTPGKAQDGGRRPAEEGQDDAAAERKRIETPADDQRQ